jgi:predicted small secreted protein
VNSLEKKKIFSYLKYALGEIILVVIGILVAVYINNKNEEIKQQKELKNIFTIINNDLKNDIKEAKVIVLNEESKKELYERFFNGKVTHKDYTENVKYRRLIFGYPEISFNTRGFKLLNDFKNIDKSKDSLVIKTIELYTHRIDEVNADDDLRDKEFKETYSFWKKQNWWLSYIKSFESKNKFNSEEFISYALNSQDYKNRVTTWRFVNYLVFIPEVKQFIKESEEIINLIESRENR